MKTKYTPKAGPELWWAVRQTTATSPSGEQMEVRFRVTSCIAQTGFEARKLLQAKLGHDGIPFDVEPEVPLTVSDEYIGSKPEPSNGALSSHPALSPGPRNMAAVEAHFRDLKAAFEEANTMEPTSVGVFHDPGVVYLVVEQPLTSSVVRLRVDTGMVDRVIGMLQKEKELAASEVASQGENRG